MGAHPVSDGKWLRELREDMPVVTAARHALLARLTPLRELLPRAVFQADEDPEHVHQLRVSARRAGAALRIFERCLPKKTCNRVRKQLQRVRRAAGAARDWDVFLGTLSLRQRKASKKQQAGFDFLRGVGQGERMAAQDVLVQATRPPDLDVDAMIRSTLAALKAPADMPVGYCLRDLAIPLLTNQIGQLNQAAKQDLRDYDKLHQVRIRGKHLRYAMEVFVSCFTKPFENEFYPAVESMQEILGRANDSHVAVNRLEAIRVRLKATQPMQWKRYEPGLEALQRYHARAMPRQRRRFLGWWRDWQDSGAEAALARMVNEV